MRFSSLSVLGFIFTCSLGFVGCKGETGDTCKEADDCNMLMCCRAVSSDSRGSCAAVCDSVVDSGPRPDTGPTPDVGPMPDVPMTIDGSIDVIASDVLTPDAPIDAPVDTNDAGPDDVGIDAPTDAAADAFDSSVDAINDASMLDADAMLPDADAA